MKISPLPVRRITPRLFASAMAVLWIVCAGNLSATEIAWTNTAGGEWNAAGNWSVGAVPGAEDYGRLTNTTVSYVVNYDQPMSAASFTNLDIRTGSGKTTTLNINTNGFVVTGGNFPSSYYVTLYTGAILNVNTGGVFVAKGVGNHFYVGSTAKLNINGGVMTNTTDKQFALRDGGTMTVNSGTFVNNAGNSFRMSSAGSSTLNIYGGFFQEGVQLTVAEGVSSTAIVTMTNGTMVLKNLGLKLGGNTAAQGTMTVSGGTVLNEGDTFVGGFSGGAQGFLNISGGSNVISKTLQVGSLYGSTGVVTMSGGYLSVTNLYLGTNATTSGWGRFVLSQGGILETSNLVTGIGGSGIFTNQSGGVLQFITATPNITTNTEGSVVVSDAVIAYRNVDAADVRNAQIAKIAFAGANTFRLNASSNAASGQSYTFGAGLGASNYVRLEMVQGATAWRGGSLTIGDGGALLVSNTTAHIAGAVTNAGALTVLNAQVVYHGNVVNLGAYVSDPSTNTFNGNFTVGPTATVVAAEDDLYAFGSNFTMQSTNRAFDMSAAKVVFADTGFGITTGTTNHVLDLSGSGALDLGSNWISIAQLATNFAIGTLNIAVNNSLQITGGVANALYIGTLDIGGLNTNLLGSILTLNVNLYYDQHLAGNAYLDGKTFQFAGWEGSLIPIPEASTFGAMAMGLALLVVLRRRR
ncbi:MAG: hypothetical protein IT578_10480 [Verrucomicrobiae bacterium]|nr:hypothetical protein [Verrucomicrobiae bacterium]